MSEEYNEFVSRFVKELSEQLGIPMDLLATTDPEELRKQERFIKNITAMRIAVQNDDREWLERLGKTKQPATGEKEVK